MYNYTAYVLFYLLFKITENMLFFGILSILLAVAFAKDTCYTDVGAACNSLPKPGDKSIQEIYEILIEISLCIDI